MNGKELKEKRLAKNIGGSQLARFVQVSRQSVEQWERGVQKIPYWLELIMDNIDYFIRKGYLERAKAKRKTKKEMETGKCAKE